MSECEHVWGFVVPYWRGADKVFIVCENPKCKMVLTKSMAEAMLNECAAIKNERLRFIKANAEVARLNADLVDENAALKREPIWTGKRIEIRRGDSWLREGRKGTAVGEPVFVQQNWLPVLWDDEEDPTFSKLAAIALLTEEQDDDSK